MRPRTRRIGRRGLLLSGAAAGLGTLATRTASAQQRSQGSGGIEWLDFVPPREYAVGARVGNIVYLSGVTGSGDGDVTAHTERAFAAIQANLQALGSDLPYIFKISVFLANMDDQPAFERVRARYLPRPVVSTVIAISRFVSPRALLEIEVTAVVPSA